MHDIIDIESVTHRLMQTLAQIQAMLGDDRDAEERQQADYFDMLRRKASGELDGNVTAQFFS
ncbi:hypothetical protein [Aureimonas sp. SK2]|uniref:hypothetical protein n=1 Tax=Aureimonas sp. SK2 TaxID=3015992 RepID=UPI0024444901|nr:hypothetical protein [Aureimonas sp. SK2]